MNAHMHVQMSPAADVYLAEGTHLLADLSGVDAGKLTDCAAINALLRSAAKAAGATILHSHFHAFGPGLGVTGVVLLAESHISIHTWPEQRFAAVDIFMCGSARPQRALDRINAVLAPAQCRLRAMQRRAMHAEPANVPVPASRSSA